MVPNKIDSAPRIMLKLSCLLKTDINLLEKEAILLGGNEEVELDLKSAYQDSTLNIAIFQPFFNKKSY